MMGGYHWAGPKWQEKDRSKTIARIIGAGIQSDDPDALAERWGELLQRPVGQAKEGEGKEIALDNAFVRFGPPRDDRGEGLRSVHLKCRDKAAVLAAAKQAGAASGENFVDLVGVRFVLA